MAKADEVYEFVGAPPGNGHPLETLVGRKFRLVEEIDDPMAAGGPEKGWLAVDIANGDRRVFLHKHNHFTSDLKKVK